MFGSLKPSDDVEIHLVGPLPLSTTRKCLTPVYTANIDSFGADGHDNQQTTPRGSKYRYKNTIVITFWELGQLQQYEK